MDRASTLVRDRALARRQTQMGSRPVRKVRAETKQTEGEKGGGMSTMVYCCCGCVWNSRSFSECPKCEEKAIKTEGEKGEGMNDLLKEQLLSMQTVARESLKQGQEIGRREAEAQIAALEADCMTLVLRLYGENDNTFAPETRRVMERWRPRAKALLEGEAA